MSNPIDWGNSPMQVSLVRGIIAAILVGLAAGLASSMSGDPNDLAIKIGLSGAIPSLLVLLGFGASDSNRANHGVVIAGDAPVQPIAKIEDKTTTAVAKEVTADVQAKL